MIAERLAAARAELPQKPLAQIDAETAAVWGARAVAAIELWRATGDPRWRDIAIEFKHEALEHAAGGPPGTLETIRAELRQLGGF